MTVSSIGTLKSIVWGGENGLGCEGTLNTVSTELSANNGGVNFATVPRMYSCASGILSILEDVELEDEQDAIVILQVIPKRQMIMVFCVECVKLLMLTPVCACG
jgi:hypothetical protein